MLIAYPESNVRRSIYAILLFLAVLGPSLLIALAIKDVRADWIQITAIFATMASIPLLCIWCALYVREEPQRVRIALTWIAALFLYVLLFLLAHSTVT
jgi:peptidoglycan/LPS O-acetylase OafA/YrhL